MAESSNLQTGVHTELADVINRETDRLTRLVSNLLDMSRLEAGALRPKCEWVSIADVISVVLDRMEPIVPVEPRLGIAVREPSHLLAAGDCVVAQELGTHVINSHVMENPAPH